MRQSILCLLIVVSVQSFAQIRMGSLILKTKEEYKIVGSDIVVVDTLIMRDSSKIFLNPEKKENFFHAKIVVIGKGCQFIGKGTDGLAGKSGVWGAEPGGPCRDGSAGKDGLPGTNGLDGISLSLYLNELRINGSFIINLNGGNGGKGGAGGRGGDGSPGTRVCKGGTGGIGGNGSAGGNAGNGGNITIHCKECTDLHLLKDERLFIKTYGGYAGAAGEGGLGGQAGLGPSQDGKNGVKGAIGKKGMAGKPGVINFERN